MASAGDVGHASCPNELSPGYRTYLPDCRAYELVTPSYKGGFSVEVLNISEDGSQLEARSFGVFSNPRDTGGLGGVYDLVRTPSGWRSLPLDAPFSMFTGFNVEAISPDFTSSLWFANAPSASPISGIYLSEPPLSFGLLGPSGPATVGFRVLSLAGASRNFSHSVFFARAPGFAEKSELWPGDKTAGEEQPSLYEYVAGDKTDPRLVGVSNRGVVASIEAGDPISECGTYLGGPSENAYNAVSEDGSKTFFTALGRDYSACGKLNPNVQPPVNELYARLDGGLADAESVSISEPSESDCGECDLSGQADAEFQGASLDGSKVFFTTAQSLLPGAHGVGTNLYEYNFDGPAGRRVTLLSGGDPADARIQRIVRVSEDGSHVYFVAQGILQAASNAFGRQAEEGKENLYVYERDAAHPEGHVAFIATAGVGTAQATPDGGFLVFESSVDLTPDEEELPEAGQVFEYDAQTAALVRVSRGQDGYNEDGNSVVYPASIPSQGYRQDLPVNEFTKLAVSGDGAYVFFTTEDSLTPQALNGAVNVYEYHEGQVALISDGHDLAASVLEEPPVQLLGTDESGRDVYFRTADQLVPQDTDTQLDVYDARVEGGFPAAAEKSDCFGDSCQGPLASAPQASVSPTSSSGGESASKAVSEVSGETTKGKQAPKRAKTKAKTKKKRGKKSPRKVKKSARGGR